MRAMMCGMILAMTAAGAPVDVGAQTRYGPSAPAPRVPGINGGADAAREPTVGRDLGDVREQIRRGRTSGKLTRQDGRRLRRQASQIDDLADRYAADGLSDPERQELQLRAGVLRDQVNRDRLRGAGRK
ncbi:MAG: hypothetical protein V4537_15390 [Pseudomonadota bacterium]